MRNNFRTKKYTSRISNISKAGIEKLRATQLKKSNISADRKKFLQSKSFDKQIRANIRENRIRENRRVIEEISKSTNKADLRNNLKSFFQESTRISNGRVIRTNTLTSLKQTKRLKRIATQMKNGTFDPLKNIKRTKRYQERRKYIPIGTITDAKELLETILTKTLRTQFYLENESLVKTHNSNVDKYGVYKAEKMKAGRNLQQKYYEDTQPELVKDLSTIE